MGFGTHSLTHVNPLTGLEVGHLSILNVQTSLRFSLMVSKESSLLTLTSCTIL